MHDLDRVSLSPSIGVRTKPVHTDVGDVIVRLDHPLAERRSVTGPDLRGLTWVTSPLGTACHDWFQRLLGGVEPNARVRHRIDDFSTQLALVDACGLTALVPRLARPPLPDTLRAVPIEPAPARRVDAVWRVASDRNPALHAVVDALVHEDGSAA